VPRRAAAAQHDTLRSLQQLTSSHDVSDCLAGVTYAASHCDVPPRRVSDGQRVTAAISRAATLTLAFLNCGEERATAVGVSYVLLNPGGQNLPTAEAPLPSVYTAFAAAWGIFAAVAGGVLSARRAWCSPLHATLLSVLLLKIVHMSVAQAKWGALSRRGARDVPLDMTLVVVLTMSQVNYLGVLLLLSRGWAVTRSSLGAPERNSLLLSLSLLASLFFVYYLWSPRSFFALAIAYICVLGFALSSVSYGLRHLKAQAHLLRLSGTEADDAAAWARVQMFTGFHGAMFVFTCVKIVLHLVALFMPEEAWLNVLFAEVSDFGLAAVVAVLFRPRRVSPFVAEGTEGVLHAAAGAAIAGRGRLSVPPSDDELARAIAQLQGRAGSDGAQAHAHTAAQAQAAAQAAAPAALPVLVENPCSFDAFGRPVMSVSVGMPQGQRQGHKPEEAHAPPQEEAQAGSGGMDGEAAAAAAAAEEEEEQAHRAAPAHSGAQQWQQSAVSVGVDARDTPAAAAAAAAAAATQPLDAPPPPAPHLQLHVTANPLWGGRLTQTQPPERDDAVAAADRFRIRWGAPPDAPPPPLAATELHRFS
jgi:hypothetical protein